MSRVDLRQEGIAHRYQAKINASPFSRCAYVDRLCFVFEGIGRINGQRQLINRVHSVDRLQRVIENERTCFSGRQRLVTPEGIFVLTSGCYFLKEVRNSVYHQLQRIYRVAAIDVFERVVQRVSTRSKESVFFLAPKETVIHVNSRVLCKEMTRQNGSCECNDRVTSVDVLLRHKDAIFCSNEVPFSGKLNRVTVAEGSLILTVCGRYRRNDQLFLNRIGSEVELIARLRSRDRYRSGSQRIEGRTFYACDRLIGRSIFYRQFGRSGSRQFEAHALVEQLGEDILPCDSLCELTVFYMNCHLDGSSGIDGIIRRSEDYREGLLSCFRRRLWSLPSERTFYRALSADELGVSKTLSYCDFSCLRSFGDRRRSQLDLYRLSIRSGLVTVVTYLISGDSNRSGSKDNQLLVLIHISDSTVRTEVNNLQTARCCSVERLQRISRQARCS